METPIEELFGVEKLMSVEERLKNSTISLD